MALFDCLTVGFSGVLGNSHASFILLPNEELFFTLVSHSLMIRMCRPKMKFSQDLVLLIILYFASIRAGHETKKTK